MSTQNSKSSSLSFKRLALCGVVILAALGLLSRFFDKNPDLRMAIIMGFLAVAIYAYHRHSTIKRQSLPKASSTVTAVKPRVTPRAQSNDYGINPASMLPMQDEFTDIGGNPLGMDNRHSNHD